MKGLLYKDFCLMRAELLFLAVLQVVLSGANIAIAVFSAGEGNATLIMLVTLGCTYAVFLVASLTMPRLFSKDEGQAWIQFAAASPAGMDGQVRSKYYFILIEYLLFLFCGMMTDTVCCAVMGSTECTATLLLMLVFSLRLLFIAVELPFTLRFGSGYGEKFKVLLILAALVLVGLYVLFGNIALFRAEDPKLAILEYVTGGALIYVIAAIPYVSVAGFYLSYRIALKVYRKGSQEYEQ